MAIWLWGAQHWFEIISAVGIIGGLCFTAASFRSEAKTRRIANLLTLTQNHRELLKVFFKDIPLTRILETSADIKSTPVTQAEEIYMSVLIQHLSSVYRATTSDLTIKPESIKLDVREFFALPIPKFVWHKLKPFQDRDFVQFVEDCLERE